MCSNNIREERQYGALEVKDGKFIIIDAEEFCYFDEYMQSLKVNKGKERPKQPAYVRTEPEEDKQPVLAYGVLIPQYDSDMNTWKKELEQYKNFAFGTLEEHQLYLSAYREFELFEENKVFDNHIPCALLFDTSLDLSKEKDYGFGYTSFLLYKDMEIFDNIFNRQFLFCLGDVENSFKSDDLENWTKYIDKNKLMDIANRLF